MNEVYLSREINATEKPRGKGFLRSWRSLHRGFISVPAMYNDACRDVVGRNRGLLVIIYVDITFYFYSYVFNIWRKRKPSNNNNDSYPSHVM